MTTERIVASKSAFKKNGTVTASNSSQTTDGASVFVVMSEEKAADVNLKSLAAFKAVAGRDPAIMGVGVSIPKVMKLAQMSLNNIELIELNKTFAFQFRYCINKLDLNPDIVNVNGGL